MKDVDTRKVQQVGGSTLTVSLPKEWVEAVELEAGEEVAFEDNEDGTLTLRKQGERKSPEVTYTIDADACDDSLLKRVIVAGYILGYERMLITSGESFSRDQFNEIHAIARRLNGLSIVQQEDSVIELHNLMDVTRSSVYVLMRRLRTTVLHMLDSSMYALVQGREDLIDEVEEMEDDVDMLYWLVLRQLLSSIQDPVMMDETSIDSPLHIIGNRTAIRALEGMADSINDIGEQVRALIEADVELSQGQKEKLSEMTEALHQEIVTATDGLIDQDAHAVNELLEQGSAVASQGRAFLDRLREDTEDADVLLACSRIVWNLERIETHGEYVAEIAINRVVEDESSFATLEESN